MPFKYVSPGIELVQYAVEELGLQITDAISTAIYQGNNNITQYLLTQYQPTALLNTRYVRICSRYQLDIIVSIVGVERANNILGGITCFSGNIIGGDTDDTRLLQYMCEELKLVFDCIHLISNCVLTDNLRCAAYILEFTTCEHQRATGVEYPIPICTTDQLRRIKYYRAHKI